MVLLPGGEDRPEIWTFDVCTNTWQRIARAPKRGPWPQLTYDADSDLTVMIGRSVTAYDLDHNAWAAKVDAPIPFPGWPVYDPVSGLLFVFVSDAERSEMRTYDVDTDRWREVEQKGVVPFATANELLAYDASADRIVLYTPDACVAVEDDASVDCGGDRTFEFDPRSHTWSAPRTRHARPQPRGLAHATEPDHLRRDKRADGDLRRRYGCRV